MFFSTNKTKLMQSVMVFLSLNSYIESDYTNCGPDHSVRTVVRDIAEF